MTTEFNLHAKLTQMQTDLDDLLSTHPLICPECGGWKHASEIICEDCRIAITVENTSIR